MGQRGTQIFFPHIHLGPLMSTQASPAGQSALVVQTGAVLQETGCETHRTLPSVLRSQKHGLSLQNTLAPKQNPGLVAGQSALGKQEPPWPPSWQTWFAVQTVPQAPQLAASVLVLTQRPLQLVKPPGQVHVPF